MNFSPNKCVSPEQLTLRCLFLHTNLGILNKCIICRMIHFNITRSELNLVSTGRTLLARKNWFLFFMLIIPCVPLWSTLKHIAMHFFNCRLVANTQCRWNKPMTGSFCRQLKWTDIVCTTAIECCIFGWLCSAHNTNLTNLLMIHNGVAVVSSFQSSNYKQQWNFKSPSHESLLVI